MAFVFKVGEFPFQGGQPRGESGIFDFLLQKHGKLNRFKGQEVIRLTDGGGVFFGFDDQGVEVSSVGGVEDLPKFSEDGFHFADQVSHGGSGFAHKVVQGEGLKGAAEEVGKRFARGVLFPAGMRDKVDENRRAFLEPVNLSQAEA